MKKQIKTIEDIIDIVKNQRTIVANFNDEMKAKIEWIDIEGGIPLFMLVMENDKKDLDWLSEFEIFKNWSEINEE